jgi:hypothetical protein
MNPTISFKKVRAIIITMLLVLVTNFAISHADTKYSLVKSSEIRMPLTSSVSLASGSTSSPLPPPPTLASGSTSSPLPPPPTLASGSTSSPLPPPPTLA